MDLAERGTIEDLMDKKKHNWAKLPLEVAKMITAQLLIFHADCRYRNIVHRDLKPSNVVFNRKRNCVVIDFGTARPLANES
jgi:serine/threonine protein kinase